MIFFLNILSRFVLETKRNIIVSKVYMDVKDKIIVKSDSLFRKFGIRGGQDKKNAPSFCWRRFNKNPASSYSPTRLPMQYHRR